MALPATSSTPCATSARSEEHTSELQSRLHLVCRLLLEKKKIAVDVVAFLLVLVLGDSLDRLGLGDLAPVLDDEPAPAAVEHRGRVGGLHLVPRHRAHAP